MTMADGTPSLIALCAAGIVLSSPALAGCPIERSLYSNGEAGASIEFQPRGGAAVSNKLSMRLGENIRLDGVVMWSDDVPRPNGMLMYQCPEGDVTGDEIEACTVWRGVIYAVDDAGTAGLLPHEGTTAAGQLVFPDLAWSLWNAPALGAAAMAALVSDIFTLSGCQE